MAIRRDPEEAFWECLAAGRDEAYCYRYLETDEEPIITDEPIVYEEEVPVKEGFPWLVVLATAAILPLGLYGLNRMAAATVAAKR